MHVCFVGTISTSIGKGLVVVDSRQLPQATDVRAGVWLSVHVCMWCTYTASVMDA
jgi:hypothetical protein